MMRTKNKQLFKKLQRPSNKKLSLTKMAGFSGQFQPVQKNLTNSNKLKPLIFRNIRAYICNPIALLIF